jgi:hypothetical protein
MIFSVSMVSVLGVNNVVPVYRYVKYLNCVIVVETNLNYNFV